MAQWLKQSTTVTLKIGPFLDKDDSVTEETGLTPTIEIAKNAGVFAARNSATAVAHDAEGWYDVELDTTDTNTLGRLVLKAQDNTTHLAVWNEYMVVPANVWDSLYSTDKLQVDAVELNSDATAAANLSSSALTMITGTVDDSVLTPTTSQFEADDITEATADHFNGRLIVFTSGALIRQTRGVTDYAKVGSNGRFTVSTMTEAPANNDTFIII